MKYVLVIVTCLSFGFLTACQVSPSSGGGSTVTSGSKEGGGGGGGC